MSEHKIVYQVVRSALNKQKAAKNTLMRKELTGEYEKIWKSETQLNKRLKNGKGYREGIILRLRTSNDVPV